MDQDREETAEIALLILIQDKNSCLDKSFNPFGAIEQNVCCFMKINL